MTNIFPDLLRAIVTDVMLILLLCTMATPKYKSKWVYVLVTVVLLIINIGANYYFYLAQNYTAVFYIDLMMLLVIGIVLKPLFKDKMMQWCFSYLTMLNIYAAVVFLSYILCDFFPNPYYAITFLRFIFFSVIAFVFHKWVSKLYRKVLDYWHIYFLPVVSLLLCFLGYFFGGDIEERLYDNFLPLILLVLLGLSIYIGIIHSLKTLTREYATREENQRMQNSHQLLRQAAHSMEQRIALMAESQQKMSILNHDRRHFNNTLLELLSKGDVEEIGILLRRQQNLSAVSPQKMYCENPATNAAISHYVVLAESKGISCNIHTQIPKEPFVDSLELSMVLSNLMENAINACTMLPQGEKRYLNLTVICEKQLIIEIENPYQGEILLEENSIPTSTKTGHGIGTKAIRIFAEHYCGDVIYQTNNGVFNVRIFC
ncbi:ATP-binding protein [Sporanaerobium hydrogeniformans]|uniref:ATP-binding protein n=1 Tax=Sporanaerobium hydrogeniformans TaxID=3072179 RepID=A0AC61DB76_9FIRM|nr:GHKL domain-containing protein [Sporanaerobium hydrogeniformans]PHV70500.1 ATP-binding protein [Sporanaerobium hydrogeniformans]